MTTETETIAPWRYEGEATGLAARIHNDLFALMKGVCGEAWDKLDEFQQELRIGQLERVSLAIVAGVVGFVADAGFEHVPIKIGKFTFDEAIKGQYETLGDLNFLNLIAASQGHEALIVFASGKKFAERRAWIRAEPDQSQIPLDAEEDDPAADPEDASDVDPVAAAAQQAWDEEDGTAPAAPAMPT